MSSLKTVNDLNNRGEKAPVLRLFDIESVIVDGKRFLPVMHAPNVENQCTETFYIEDNRDETGQQKFHGDLLCFQMIEPFYNPHPKTVTDDDE